MDGESSILKPISKYSFGNPKPVFEFVPILAKLCLAIREGNFSALQKNQMSINNVTKNIFCLKFPKVLTLLDYTGSQLSRISWIISKCCIEIPVTCSHLLGFKIFERMFSAD